MQLAFLCIWQFWAPHGILVRLPTSGAGGLPGNALLLPPAIDGPSPIFHCTSPAMIVKAPSSSSSAADGPWSHLWCCLARSSSHLVSSSVEEFVGLGIRVLSRHFSTIRFKIKLNRAALKKRVNLAICSFSCDLAATFCRILSRMMISIG